MKDRKKVEKLALFVLAKFLELDKEFDEVRCKICGEDAPLGQNIKLEHSDLCPVGMAMEFMNFKAIFDPEDFELGDKVLYEKDHYYIKSINTRLNGPTIFFLSREKGGDVVDASLNGYGMTFVSRDYGEYEDMIKILESLE